MNLARPKVTSSLEWVALVLAVYFLGAFLFIAFSSLAYPFHLEWMEGHSIDVIARVRAGLPIYTKPSLEYVPFLYTPFYYYVSAFVSLFTGVDFLPGRLVSTFSTLGSAACIVLWVRREYSHTLAGVIAAGLFLATYALSGRWFDVARIDSLALFLALSCAYGLRLGTTHLHALFTALLLVATVFTKQSMLIMLLPPLLYTALERKTFALSVAAVAGLLLFALSLWYEAASNGWFFFYTWLVSAGHPTDWRMLQGFWRKDVFMSLWPLVAVMVIRLCSLRKEEYARSGWYVALAAGAVGLAYAARLHSYGWMNVLMPMHAVLALCAGVAIASARGDVMMTRMLVVFATLQLGLLLYTPQHFIPTAEARAQGEAFLDQLALVEGDVFTPELQWVQERVGKKSYAFGMAGFDILRADLGSHNDIRDALKAELDGAARSGRFAAIIPGRIVRIRELDRFYRFDRELNYPQEYVTGAINFFKPRVYKRKKTP